MKVYIIMIDDGDDTYISQEGYDTFEKAEQFILSRSDKPKLVANRAYRTENYHYYIIKEVDIK